MRLFGIRKNISSMFSVTNQERFEGTRATIGNLIPVGMSVLTAEFGKRRVGEPIRLRPCTFFQLCNEIGSCHNQSGALSMEFLSPFNLNTGIRGSSTVMRLIIYNVSKHWLVVSQSVHEKGENHCGAGIFLICVS